MAESVDLNISDNLPTSKNISGTVVSVYDGDTFQVESSGKVYNVRIFGIDAPELAFFGSETTRPHPAQQDSEQAKNHLTTLIPIGSAVTLNLEGSNSSAGNFVPTHSYNRLISRVSNGTYSDVGRQMIADGYAWAASYEPSTPLNYKTTQDQAKQAVLGIWAFGRPESPWDFKRKFEKRIGIDGQELAATKGQFGRVDDTIYINDTLFKLPVEKITIKQSFKSQETQPIRSSSSFIVSGTGSYISVTLPIVCDFGSDESSDVLRVWNQIKRFPFIFVRSQYIKDYIEGTLQSIEAFRKADVSKIINENKQEINALVKQLADPASKVPVTVSEEQLTRYIESNAGTAMNYLQSKIIGNQEYMVFAVNNMNISTIPGTSNGFRFTLDIDYSLYTPYVSNLLFRRDVYSEERYKKYYEEWPKVSEMWHKANLTIEDYFTFREKTDFSKNSVSSLGESEVFNYLYNSLQPPSYDTDGNLMLNTVEDEGELKFIVTDVASKNEKLLKSLDFPSSVASYISFNYSFSIAPILLQGMPFPVHQYLGVSSATGRIGFVSNTPEDFNTLNAVTNLYNYIQSVAPKIRTKLDLGQPRSIVPKIQIQNGFLNSFGIKNVVFNAQIKETIQGTSDGEQLVLSFIDGSRNNPDSFTATRTKFGGNGNIYLPILRDHYSKKYQEISRNGLKKTFIFNFYLHKLLEVMLEGSSVGVSPEDMLHWAGISSMHDIPASKGVGDQNYYLKKFEGKYARHDVRGANPATTPFVVSSGKHTTIPLNMTVELNLPALATDKTLKEQYDQVLKACIKFVADSDTSTLAGINQFIELMYADFSSSFSIVKNVASNKPFFALTPLANKQSTMLEFREAAIGAAIESGTGSGFRKKIIPALLAYRVLELIYNQIDPDCKFVISTFNVPAYPGLKVETQSTVGAERSSQTQTADPAVLLAAAKKGSTAYYLAQGGKNLGLGEKGKGKDPEAAIKFVQARIVKYADKYNLDPILFLAHMEQESSYRPFVVSPDGALGIGQMMPATASESGLIVPSNLVELDRQRIEAGSTGNIEANNRARKAMSEAILSKRDNLMNDFKSGDYSAVVEDQRFDIDSGLNAAARLVSKLLKGTSAAGSDSLELAITSYNAGTGWGTRGSRKDLEKLRKAAHGELWDKYVKDKNGNLVINTRAKEADEYYEKIVARQSKYDESYLDDLRRINDEYEKQLEAGDEVAGQDAAPVPTPVTETTQVPSGQTTEPVKSENIPDLYNPTFYWARNINNTLTDVALAAVPYVVGHLIEQGLIDSANENYVDLIINAARINTGPCYPDFHLPKDRYIQRLAQENVQVGDKLALGAYDRFINPDYFIYSDIEQTILTNTVYTKTDSSESSSTDPRVQAIAKRGLPDDIAIGLTKSHMTGVNSHFQNPDVDGYLEERYEKGRPEVVSRTFEPIKAPAINGDIIANGGDRPLAVENFADAASEVTATTTHEKMPMGEFEMPLGSRKMANGEPSEMYVHSIDYNNDDYIKNDLMAAATKSYMDDNPGFRKAFPTFKIFFIEEDSIDSDYQVLDDFYDTSGLLELSIVEEAGNPIQTAFMTFINPGQKIITPEMAMSEHEKLTQSNIRKLTEENSPSRGPDETQLEERFASYFPLKENTKIMIYMGYDQDVNNLTKKFVGFVSQIDGGEIINLVAQSYGAEFILDRQSSARAFGKELSERFEGEEWERSGDEDTTTFGSALARSILSQPMIRHFGRWEVVGLSGLKTNSIQKIRNEIEQEKDFFTSMIQGSVFQNFKEPSFLRRALVFYGYLKGSNYDENIFLPFNQDIEDEYESISLKNAHSWRLLQEITYKYPGIVVYPMPYEQRMTLYVGPATGKYAFRDYNLAEIFYAKKNMNDKRSIFDTYMDSFFMSDNYEIENDVYLDGHSVMSVGQLDSLVAKKVAALNQTLPDALKITDGEVKSLMLIGGSTKDVQAKINKLLTLLPLIDGATTSLSNTNGGFSDVFELQYQLEEVEINAFSYYYEKINLELDQSVEAYGSPTSKDAVAIIMAFIQRYLEIKNLFYMAGVTQKTRLKNITGVFMSFVITMFDKYYNDVKKDIEASQERFSLTNEANAFLKGNGDSFKESVRTVSSKSLGDFRNQYLNVNADVVLGNKNPTIVHLSNEDLLFYPSERADKDGPTFRLNSFIDSAIFAYSLFNGGAGLKPEEKKNVDRYKQRVQMIIKALDLFIKGDYVDDNYYAATMGVILNAIIVEEEVDEDAYNKLFNATDMSIWAQIATAAGTIATAAAAVYGFSGGLLILLAAVAIGGPAAASKIIRIIESWNLIGKGEGFTGVETFKVNTISWVIISSILDNKSPFFTQFSKMNSLVNSRTKLFRQYHFASSMKNIVYNGIKYTDRNVFNAVTIVDEDGDEKCFMKFDDNMPDHRLKVLPYNTGTEISELEAERYAASILDQSAKRSYDGSLIILGNPNIKPYDYIHLNDTYRSMYGFIEVRNVVTTLNRSGFITEITPALCTSLNDSVNPSVLSAIGFNFLNLFGFEADTPEQYYQYRHFLENKGLGGFAANEEEKQKAKDTMDRIARRLATDRTSFNLAAWGGAYVAATGTVGGGVAAAAVIFLGIDGGVAVASTALIMWASACLFMFPDNTKKFPVMVHPLIQNNEPFFADSFNPKYIPQMTIVKNQLVKRSIGISHVIDQIAAFPGNVYENAPLNLAKILLGEIAANPR